MANRHLSRSIVLQSLFEWDFGSKNQTDAEGIFLRNSKEFGAGLGDSTFMETLLHGVMDKRKDIDLIIEKAAPDWPIDKISVIDRNILRIGLYELLFADRSQVPPKVAINESIENIWRRHLLKVCKRRTRRGVQRTRRAGQRRNLKAKKGKCTATS